METTTKEKLSRILNPQQPQDYGLALDLIDVVTEAPETFEREIAPYLPQEVVEDLRQATK